MNIRPMSPEDLRQWWGDVEITRTVRGFTAEKDGQVLGVAGLMYMPSAIIAFAEMGEDCQKYPMTIMRIARLMRELMRGRIAPVFAVADTNWPNSEAFLEHVGFERVAGRQFVFKKEGG
jgi:N-acetylglutamate synthase-like GNAT family acetyltransferase